MQTKFRPYLCNVNDVLASVMVDLALIDVAPIRSKPCLLWIWVYMQMPRADGLSDSNEAPRLYEIEDSLVLNFCSDERALLAGRITTDGRREFYFYGGTEEGFEEAVKKALAAFGEYTFTFGTQEDPQWNQYLNVLYPSKYDLQRISNGDVLGVLAKRGDVPSVPRKVMHWSYFPSEENRSLFCEDAVGEGFTVDSENELGSKLPFCLCLCRVQGIQQADIDETTLKLLELSEQHEGEYDGWETQVTTQ
jgi:hypothetical protein